MPGNLFWPNDEKRGTTTSCDNWNDRSEKVLDGPTKWFKVGRMTWIEMYKTRRA